MNYKTKKQTKIPAYWGRDPQFNAAAAGLGISNDRYSLAAATQAASLAGLHQASK